MGQFGQNTTCCFRTLAVILVSDLFSSIVYRKQRTNQNFARGMKLDCFFPQWPKNNNTKTHCKPNACTKLFAAAHNNSPLSVSNETVTRHTFFLVLNPFVSKQKRLSFSCFIRLVFTIYLFISHARVFLLAVSSSYCFFLFSPQQVVVCCNCCVVNLSSNTFIFFLFCNELHIIIVN